MANYFDEDPATTCARHGGTWPCIDCKREQDRVRDIEATIDQEQAIAVQLMNERDYWKARAIAAEAITKCFAGVTAQNVMDAASALTSVSTVYPDMKPALFRAIHALDALATVLRDRERSR